MSEPAKAARSVGTASISFGLVTIPVKLYAATSDGNTVSFNMLHNKCNSRLKQQYVCSKDGEVVSREDTVKGYEFARDQYVVFTPAEIKELQEKSTQTIEISEFVPSSEIDPVWYDKPYHLAPDKGGDKGYALLTKAMGDSGKVALGRYGARGKQYLVMLRAAGGRLVMQQLHYADEVKPMDAIPSASAAKISDAELAMAQQLISALSAELFNPASYEDAVRKRITEAIGQKVDGKEISITPDAKPAEVIDIMSALQASLAAKKAS